MKNFVSCKQKDLFRALESEGEIVLAVGPRGAVANLVGIFTVRKNHLEEDQLDVNDGTSHVHLDWSRIRGVEVSSVGDEGLLTFFDGNEALFRMYRMGGHYSEIVRQHVGMLTDVNEM